MIIHTTHTDYHMLSMPCANSHVRFYVDNFSRLQTVELYSYNTLILSMDCNTWDKKQDDNIHVYAPVNYSRSTARHVVRFTEELVGENLYSALKNGDVEVPDLWFKCVELHEKYVRSARLYR